MWGHLVVTRLSTLGALGRGHLKATRLFAQGSLRRGHLVIANWFCYRRLGMQSPNAYQVTPP